MDSTDAEESISLVSYNEPQSPGADDYLHLQADSALEGYRSSNFGDENSITSRSNCDLFEQETIELDDCINAQKKEFVRMIIIPLCMANAADAVEILSVGYIITNWTDRSGNALTSVDKELLTSSVFFGMLVGGIVWGIGADVWGRRSCLLVSLMVNAVFGGLSAFSPSVGWLVVFRVVAGLGVGGSIPCVFTLAAELFPTNVRGKLLAGVASFWMVGSMYGSGVAWILLGDTIGGTRIMPLATWRHYAVLAAIPAALAFLLNLWKVPESPRFLLKKGRVAEASVVLSDMTGVYVDERKLSHLESPLDESLEQDDSHHHAHHHTKGAAGTAGTGAVTSVLRQTRESLHSLFAPGLNTTTTVLMLIWFTLSYSSYGIGTWNNQLFQDIGLSNPYLSSFIYVMANLPGNVFSILVVEKVGRKRLLMWSMAFAAVFSTLFAFGQKGGAVLIIFAASMFNALSTAGWNCLDALSTESFPTGVRSTGMGAVAASGRLGSVAAQFVNGALEKNIPALLMVTSGLTLAGSFITACLPRETGGQSLDDCDGGGEEGVDCNGHGHRALGGGKTITT